MPTMTELIDVYAERLRAAGRSPYTITVRCRVLRRAHQLLPHGLDGASGDEIAALLAQQRTNWTKSTYYSHLHGYYSAMVQAGKLTLDPTSSIDRPQPGDSTPHPVTTEELFAALSLSPDHPWRSAIILGGYAGLRCAEMAALTRADITQERVHVRRGKGGRARFIPTHAAVWELARSRSGPILVDAAGQPFTAEQLTKRQNLHWRRIGMPEIHLHRFRHWFGTTLVDNGVGIDVVRELMGHRSIATTQGYVRVSQARRDAAIGQLPNTTPEPDGSRLRHSGVNHNATRCVI